VPGLQAQPLRRRRDRGRQRRFHDALSISVAFSPRCLNGSAEPLFWGNSHMAEKEFEGQTAVVTGGANGLGFAIARLLAERGAKIALWDIDKDKLRQAKERLMQQGAEAATYEADV